MFAKILDKYHAAQKKHIQTHTDFLDPARCAAFMTVLAGRKTRGLAYLPQGGYTHAERKVIVFQPEFEDGAPSPIVPLAITYNKKFSSAPSHRDYLGAVIGLGLDRGKVGDICLAEGGATMYVLEEVAYFIAESLTQAGRTSINIEVGQTLAEAEPTGKEKRITVASMRLDGVLSAALNLSRGKAAALIEKEKVFVNWKLAKKTHTIAVGDAITVRGVGRVTIDEECGTSKRDRIVLVVTV